MSRLRLALSAAIALTTRISRAQEAAPPIDLEQTHAFVGLSWLAGFATTMTDNTHVLGTTSSGLDLRGSYAFALHGGVLFDRNELALEVSPFTYVPHTPIAYQPRFTLASPYARTNTFSTPAFQVNASYAYRIRVHDGIPAIEWPLRFGAGCFVGADGIVYYEGIVEVIGPSLRVGHVMIDLKLPSFRYAISLTEMRHLFSWDAGLMARYIF